MNDHGHVRAPTYGLHVALAGTKTSCMMDSTVIKRKALELGADMVNICAVNPGWLFRTSKVPTSEGTVRFARVLVIGVAMDPEAFRVSPSAAIKEETHHGYRRMEEIALALGDYLSRLGYNAYSAGNGEALSIPLAIDAGMGTLGRNGLLLATECGPCLRICKVFTDMPLLPDARPERVLAERCAACTICSDACPANAIESGAAPSHERWRVDRHRCGKYWKETSQECAACISSCPATWEDCRTRPAEHAVTKEGTSVQPSPPCDGATRAAHED